MLFGLCSVSLTPVSIKYSKLSQILINKQQGFNKYLSRAYHKDVHYDSLNYIMTY